MNISTKAGLLAMAIMGLVSGCGGGDDGPGVAAAPSAGAVTAAPSATAVTGKFVDATVVGLGYKCGTATALTGSTDAKGEFTCKSDESVSFYVGGIKLGTVASAQAVVTPLDLAGAGATPGNTTVNNIVRFLMSISSTAASSGVLTIDPAVAAAASTRSIDFTSVLAADLESAIKAIKPGSTIATVQQARDHMAGSIFGLFAGAYAGSFSGTASGNWNITIDGTGKVSGTATDTTGATFAVTGSMATTLGTGSSYSFSGSGGGTPWTGTLNMNSRSFSGTWGGGTFTGKGSAAATPAASSSNSTNTLIVSGVTPTTGNGNFSLPIAVETAAGGTSTDMRVEFTDATPATRTLRLYYAPSTGALKAVQYNSSTANFGCFVGDVVAPCQTTKITFSASGKSILLDLAGFKSGTTTNGVLEGLLKW